MGLALSDPSGTFARPLEVLENSPRLFDALREIVRREEVARVVLGLPRNMDGSLGPKARQVQDFKEKLEAELGVDVVLWDERLTTVQAERMLDDAGASRGRRKRTVDKLAAQILLQSCLDAGCQDGGNRP